ncbi:MAG: hypothetical protein JWR10_1582 [Rubritepida sp.]|nr:hypothetical protein [Rubritepida sp.]
MITTFRRAAVFAALFAALPAAAQNATRQYADASHCGAGSAFVVENAAEVPVTEIFVRVTGSSAWGPDRLGERILPRGERLELDPGQQIVDVLILTADNRALLAARQNACVISAIRVNGDRTLGIR